jgi:hypothetical protein
MSFGEIVFAMVMSGVFGLWVYGIIITDGDTMRRIFWDNTAIGWVWREYFSKKKKAKQAPPHFTNQFGHQIPISVPPPAMPTSFNTSSNFTFPIQTGRPMGKPLVIQNWDRLTGMMIPILTNPNFNGHNWIVVNAGQTTDGYECMFENSAMRKAVILTVYSDIYDSHRVMVKCGGRMSIMDIETFKDPNNMLYRIANEFNEKFR